jgi:hypothetical protein
MATAAVQQAPPLPSAYQAEPLKRAERHDVHTSLNYYKDPGDGSAPAPSYVGKPETYERPVQPFDVTVTDISGNVGDYNLDNHGFLIYNHESKEKAFRDEEKIKGEYYPEVEQLLKDA